ncbi:KpsF/GutQ family sugar-phosphate isomerase [Alteromonas sp. 5E99-2]|uniref:KpsF/GutQ family sugar-phosphate isomerase n=1 Tax=Alteromonas sp. 5E99-2 TaxID=2817683 RepID=UPI001F61A022|nr:KpsF/GutQ family sugar-phosphate isomerase [Alteromonas sp. 5E99-2]
MTSKSSESALLDSAKRVIDIESDALANLRNCINSAFISACHTLLNCKGKVVVTGMGKSGHIGNKIAATFASTGTPSFFMHPAEANHGDLGMLGSDDVLIAISNSGETAEVINLLPVVKRLGVPIITITNAVSSTLAQHGDIVLDIGVNKEACSLGLAPTTSTTVTLVLGDALAVSLLDARGFTSTDFALSHPGGSLGRKLLLQVSDIMLEGNEVPIVQQTTLVSDALIEISKKGLGCTGVIDNNGVLIGIFTDGDLRRIIDQKIDMHQTHINTVMTRNFVSVESSDMAVDALNLMEHKKISSLMVLNDAKHVIGAFNMHMLLKAGVV